MTDDDGAIVGPGDDPRHERLVLNVRVVDGSTMNLDTSEVTSLVFLSLVSRSLAEVSEQETHHFGMSKQQAEWMAAQLIQRIGELP